MGWRSEVILAQLVIIEGPNDGLFVYNGTPAAGNLIASIASASGTDSFGNAFDAGFTAYSGVNAINMNGNSLVWFVSGVAKALLQADGIGTTFSDDGAFLPLLLSFSRVQMGNQSWITPSNDLTGAADTTAIQNALNAGQEI